MLVNVAIVIATVVMIVRNNSRHCNNRFLASIYIYIYVSIYLCIYVCIYLSMYLSTYRSTCLSRATRLTGPRGTSSASSARSTRPATSCSPRIRSTKWIYVYMCIYIYIYMYMYTIISILLE